MNIGIIGLGLIGGSLSLSIQKAIPNTYALGYDAIDSHKQEALAAGIVHETVSLDALIDRSEIIIIAIPVDYIVAILPRVLDRIDQQVVFDVGSTKSEIISSVANHPNRKQYVACHPMAGTEFSGPGAAMLGIFDTKCNVICNVEESDSEAVQKVVSLLEKIGMYTVFQNAKEHDMHVAYVSHMSHISSFALALTVLHKEKSEEQILQLASGGFRSSVRLAKSNPKTWLPIFEQNRDHVLDVLDEHITVLSKFRSLLIKRDFEGFNDMMKEAGEIERILK